MNLSEQELSHLMEEAVSRALAANPHIKHRDPCPLSADDVVFFKRLKKSLDTCASWLGHGCILGMLGLLAYIVKLGIETWRSHPHG